MDETLQLVENPGRSLRYGWRCWRPTWLQCLNHPAWFLLFAALGSLATGADITGFLGATISTIEKRFHLQSKESALIGVMYELCGLPAIILVGYYGPGRNRPLWISLGTLLFASGSIIYALPHFLAYPYTYGNITQSDTCRMNSKNSTGVLDPCSDIQDDHHGSHLSAYLWVFLLASLLHSYGTVPLFTLGLPYIDDVTTKETASLYIGIFYAVTAVGPALAYLLSYCTLNVYTDINFQQGAEVLHPDDSRWVGAWWLGFLGTAVLCLTIVLPQSGFPCDMPGAAKLRAQKESEAHDDGSDILSSKPGFGQDIRDIPRTLYLLLCNSCFRSVSLGNIPDALLITGFSVYAPKILENQFGLLPSTASTYFGLLALAGAVGGSLAPGFLISRRRLSCSEILRGMFVCSLLSLVPVFCLIYCGQTTLAGVSQPYTGSSGMSLTDSCNADCGCSRLMFAPVCGADDITYFSSCYAGCTQTNSTKVRYEECACIEVTNHTTSWATSGACEARPCHLLPVFMLFAFLTMFLIMFNGTMGVQAVIRCVPTQQRSLAIGVHWVLGRILGSLPAPVLIGAILDHACILWDFTCDEDGACLRYENFQLALLLFILTFVCRIFSAIFYFMAWRLYKPPKNIQSSTNVPDMSTPEQSMTTSHQSPD